MQKHSSGVNKQVRNVKKKNHLTPLKDFQNLLYSPKMCNISMRGRLGTVTKEHSHTFTSKK